MAVGLGFCWMLTYGLWCEALSGPLWSLSSRHHCLDLDHCIQMETKWDLETEEQGVNVLGGMIRLHGLDHGG